MGKATFIILAACLVQAINCGKFGPFGPFGPYAPGAGFGMFGAGPAALGDPLLESQLQVNVLSGTLRTASMEAGMQIGQINALVGRQINAAKISMNLQIVQAQNEIKAAQNTATLQGLVVDTCVLNSKNALKLVSVNSVKLCASNADMASARLQMGQIKLMQSKVKNIVPTCQLQFPSPTQTADVSTCVTGEVDSITTEVAGLKDNLATSLNAASQDTCVADTQADVTDSINVVVNDFNTCVASASTAV